MTQQIIKAEVIEQGNGLDVNKGDYAYHAETGNVYKVTRVYSMGFRSDGGRNYLPVEVAMVGDASSITEEQFDDAWEIAL